MSIILAAILAVYTPLSCYADTIEETDTVEEETANYDEQSIQENQQDSEEVPEVGEWQEPEQTNEAETNSYDISDYIDYIPTDDVVETDDFMGDQVNDVINDLGELVTYGDGGPDESYGGNEADFGLDNEGYSEEDYGIMPLGRSVSGSGGGFTFTGGGGSFSGGAEDTTYTNLSGWQVAILDNIDGLKKYLKAVTTLADSSSQGTYGLGQLLGYIYNRVYGIYNNSATTASRLNTANQYLLDIRNWSKYTGGLRDAESGSYAVGTLLAWTYNKIYDMWEDLDDVLGTLKVTTKLADGSSSSTYSITQLITYIYNRLVGIDSHVAAIHTNSDTLIDLQKFTTTLADGKNSGTYTLPQLVAYVYNRTVGIDSHLSAIHTNSDGILDKLTYTITLADGNSAGTYSITQLVAYAYNRLVGIDNHSTAIQTNTDKIRENIAEVVSELKFTTTLTNQTNERTYTVTQLLAYVYNRLVSVDTTTGNIERVNNQILDALKFKGKLADQQTEALYSVPQLLLYLYNQAYYTNDNLKKIIENLENGETSEVSVDLTETNSLLKSIKDLLVTAGVVENTKDLVSVLVGEFDAKGTLTQSVSTLSAAARKAFPFNIPFLLIDVVGLMVVDASLPTYEFEILGNPLTVDLNSDFSAGIAEVTKWASCIILVIGLFANTNKFIYARRED